MENALEIYNSRLEVDLAAIGENVRRVRAHIGPEVDIIPVLKGNAYAAGLPEMGRFMQDECGVATVACAQAWEAWQLRLAGVRTGILIMGGVPFRNIPAVVELNLMTPAYCPEYLALLEAEAARRGRAARVHIKIETGLGRIGVKPGDELDALCRQLKGLRHVRAVGIYTHFAESENPDRTYTLLQMERFRQGVAQAREAGFEFEYIHAFNTSSIAWLRDPMVTHVRAAGIFFGFDTCLEPVNALGLTEALSWRSFVTHVKTVAPGETAGYNRVFRPTAPARVATVCMGYGDGYDRALAATQGAEMLVRGQRAPVVATCMDQTFLDVTGIEGVAVDDIVTLLGRDGDQFISVFELQKKMGQTYLATIATIQNRVHRTYIR